jgi:hypothetical protein
MREINSTVWGKERMYPCHARVSPCQTLELGEVIRIGKEADVKNQVAIGWHAIPVAEAGDVDQDFGLVPLAAETLANELAQFVNREFRGIDDQIGAGANRRARFPVSGYIPRRWAGQKACAL